MKILQISHKLPYPPLDGGSIVINSLSTGLTELRHEVTLLTMQSPKRGIQLSDIPDAYRQQVNLQTVNVDTRLRIFPALENLLFQKESYHTSRFNDSKFSALLRQILSNNRFDIIQLESIFVLGYLPLIRQSSSAKVVLRTQNIEYAIWENITKNEKNPLRRWYLSKMTKRLKSFETNGWKNVDGIIPITNVDANHILYSDRFRQPIEAIPFGMDMPESDRTETDNFIPNAIFHLGSMDWFPNLEAVNWFLEKVLPLFAAKDNAHFFLAGKFMPGHIFKKQNQRLTVESTITDPAGYMRDKPIMMVPLLSGSGIRVKIIEGMAMGKTIVATTLAAKGIDCTHNENILLADDPKDFYQAILKCLNDAGFCSMIGRNARQFVQSDYEKTAVARRFIDFYQKL